MLHTIQKIRKAASGFWIRRRPAPRPLSSAWTLDGDGRVDIVISTVDVAARMPEWIRGLGLRTVLCGHDADPAGDRAARCLEAKGPKYRRMQPDGGKERDPPEAERRVRPVTDAGLRAVAPGSDARGNDGVRGRHEQTELGRTAGAGGRDTVRMRDSHIARSEPAGIIRRDSWHTPFVAGEWGSDSWMRSQVRRWVPKARALAGGGWRELAPR